MKRSFPLAGLLRLRHLQQDQAASDLAAANSRLRDSGRRLDQARSLLGEGLSEVSDAAALHALAASRASSSSMLADLHALDALRQDEAEQARLALQQARARAIGLEKLQSQHELAAAAEELHGEQVALDEIASGAWHRGEGNR